MQNPTRDKGYAAGSQHHSVPIGNNLSVALAYAGEGIPVFPCAAAGPRGKQPLTSRGHHDATTDGDVVRCWWRRTPSALVGMPTGPASGVWVLDIDGESGRHSLNCLLVDLQLEGIADLTRCVSRTPSGGLHLFFVFQPGARPRNRARDIGAGLDTRGVKSDGSAAGYVVAPGTMLPDGRRYDFVDPCTLSPTGRDTMPFGNASPAPRKLLYLASFNASERAKIAASPELQQSILASEPEVWSDMVLRHRQPNREILTNCLAYSDDRTDQDRDRQYRYVAAILTRELGALGDMPPNSGRNDALYRMVCRIGRWVHHDILDADELIAEVFAACERNGLAQEDGRQSVLATINSALKVSKGDVLPQLGATRG